MTQMITGKFYKWVFFPFILILSFMLPGCVDIQVSNEPSQKTSSGNQMSVHFIDVGQGDSTLIEINGHYMLIDAGEKDQAETVVSYLKAHGVEALDYVIGTHPHSDHIGGLEGVIRTFHVNKIIMPGKVHTTKMYERLLDAVEEKQRKITLPKSGDVYDLEGASFQILGPNKDYGDNLNDWSIGIRLDYGENSFLFCGDAEKSAEADMINTNLSLKADVLKVSHHGSSTSSSDAFLDRISPEYAVISCGKDNDYGHPHKETMESLDKRDITVLRTDELGSIAVVSDGRNITFPGQDVGDEGHSHDNNEAYALNTIDYIVNTNTKRFHLPECNLADSIKEKNKEIISGTRDELIDMGYDPCKSCNP